MGKKNKKEKKGKGADKTARKTEKNLEKKMKKTHDPGDDDLEKLIAQFREEDRKKAQVTETVVKPPSPRGNFSLVANPDKEELILFGGEFFNGKKTYVYSDMFIYCCKKNEWTKIDAPNTPPPRCGHQAVLVKQGSSSGQMWLFGGEFASPTQSQFYHYRDLWCFHTKKRVWQLMSEKGGPSARSGHRMVCWKKSLLLFGGFSDTGAMAKYFNDLWQYDLEAGQWSALKAVGDHQPSPRSAFVFLPSPDQRHIYLVGGYSKEAVKRGVDKGVVHTDVYQLTMQGKSKTDDENANPRWVQLRPCGARPSPRCGMSGVLTGPGVRATLFGGVWDVEEDEETVSGTFFSDLMALELDTAKWHTVELRGEIPVARPARRRRKEGDAETGDDVEMEDEEKEAEDVDQMDVQEMTEVVETGRQISGMCLSEESTQEVTNDGVFTLKVDQAGSSSVDAMVVDSARDADRSEVWPSSRMNCGLAVIGQQLYLYGGMREDGNRQVTLDDLYTLDLKKMDRWNKLFEGTFEEQEWLGSDSESEGEGDSAAKSTRKVASMEVDRKGSSDEDDEDVCANAPVPEAEEAFIKYWERTSAFWEGLVRSGLEEDSEDDDDDDSDDEEVSDSVVQKYAMQTAKDFYREQAKAAV